MESAAARKSFEDAIMAAEVSTSGYGVAEIAAKQMLVAARVQTLYWKGMAELQLAYLADLEAEDQGL